MPGLTDDQKIGMAYNLNVARRHLSTAQRKELAAESLKRQPELSDAEHARRCNLSDKTVTNVRKSHPEIPDVPRIDTKNRATASTKPKPKPAEPLQPWQLDPRDLRTGSKAAPKGKTAAEKRAADKAARISATVGSITTMTANLLSDAKLLAKAALSDKQADVLEAKATALREVADQLELLAVNAKFANAKVISG